MLNVLMFCVAYSAGFFFSLFRNPVYAFSLYEVVYFFNPQQRWWGGMIPDVGYSFFVVILMLLVLVISYKHTRENKLLKVPHFKWMYALFFLYAIAYSYAIFPDAHYQASINFLKTILTISIAYKLCDSQEKLNYILYGYIFGAWYISFVAFQVGRNSGSRVEGIGTVDAPGANDVAAVIAPALVLCLYYFWTHRKWWHKGLAVVGGVFVANALVLINSRGSFLGVIISISFFMFYMFFSSFQQKHQKTLAIFIVVAGLAGAATLIDEAAIDRFSSMSQAEVDEEAESGATRTIFWVAAWDMAKNYPFGAGLNGFNYYAPIYIPENINTGASRNRTVHSTWFEALSEVGYLGLFSFMMMIYSAYWALELCKNKLQERNQVHEYFKMIAIQAALLSFVVTMTFINRMRAEVLYWLLLYAACAYNIYVLRPPLSKEKSNH